MPLPDLYTADGALTPDAAIARLQTPDLLYLDEDMVAFVERYTGDINSKRERLRNLHRAIASSSMLGLEYVADADGTAAEAFHQAQANCLSYAHLLVAMAREAGLDAHYQWLQVRPQWTRMGERVAIRLHVNVLVDMPRGEQFMVDIDPLQRNEVAGTRILEDDEAAALHHNNLAMAAFNVGQLDAAYGHLAYAIRLRPDLSLLWANLGAVYRQNEQYAAAEDSYLRGLELEPGARTPMNNLVVLYGMQGRTEERQQWLGKVERYRDSNPYYHAYLGDLAGEQKEWNEALEHYRRAVKLRPDDGHLHYQLGLIHYQLGDMEATTAALEAAIERATLLRDRQNYRARLEKINQPVLSQSG